jgi:type I restriction enzyme M protein
VEQSDPIFANLFADVDLYSTRLGTGEQKQSSLISELIKKINEADLININGDFL